MLTKTKSAQNVAIFALVAIIVRMKYEFGRISSSCLRLCGPNYILNHAKNTRSVFRFRPMTFQKYKYKSFVQIRATNAENIKF